MELQKPFLILTETQATSTNYSSPVHRKCYYLPHHPQIRIPSYSQNMQNTAVDFEPVTGVKYHVMSLIYPGSHGLHSSKGLVVREGRLTAAEPTSQPC